MQCEYTHVLTHTHTQNTPHFGWISLCLHSVGFSSSCWGHVSYTANLSPQPPPCMVLHFAASITCGHPGFKNIKWKIPGIRIFLVAQLVKNPPAMQETWVWSLGWEDPLAKGKLPTPVFWPGEFHGLYSPWGRKEWDMTERHFHFQK